MKQYQKQYSQYILDHKTNVRKAFDWLKENLLPDNPDLFDQEEVSKLIDKHDASKWSVAEFEPYALYFYVDKNKYKDDFDYAWNNHQKNNPHHWQYWVLVNDEGTKALKMPQSYIIEMLCDWWSFSWKQNNLAEIFNWYEAKRPNMILHPETEASIVSILDMMKEKLGEK